MATHHLPPIKTLFSDSWTVLKNNFTTLIIFYVLIISITVASFILMGLGLATLGITAGVTNGFEAAGIGLGVLLAVVFIIFVIAVSSSAQIGGILILYRSDKKSPLAVLKETVHYIVPVFLAGILTSVLIFGSFFLFIIPALIFSFFFAFVSYVIVTEKAGVLPSLRRSVGLVMADLPGVLLRMFIIWVISLAASFVPSVLLGNGENLGFLYQLINFVIQVAVSLFGMAYTVTLFRQLQTAHKTAQKPIKVFVILSAIGWILAILIVYFAITVLSGPILRYLEEANNAPRPATQEEINEVFGENPTLDEDIQSNEVDLTPTVTDVLPETPSSTPL